MKNLEKSVHQKEREALKALNREYKKVYSKKDESFVSDIEFYVDEMTNTYYQWKFVTPDNITHVWRYYFDECVIKKKKEY